MFLLCTLIGNGSIITKILNITKKVAEFVKKKTEKICLVICKFLIKALFVLGDFKICKSKEAERIPITNTPANVCI